MTDTYATARAMIADLEAKRVSTRELFDAHLARNEQVHAKINAIVETDIARAKKDATAIDEARARGEKLGALAGLPMTIKDGFDVQNMPATSGNPGFKDRAKDCADAALVEAVRKAGAVIWGKSNVPLMLGDFQSYNAIYGTTNNPYDVTRVPAGSSGGAAAALATGVTPLEIGSDIGGSLRHPANYCGVTSLKPTWGVLPLRGHVPPPPGMNAESDLGVAGPMARNVEDLKLLWSVLRGTPAQARRDIKGARIAVWDEEPGWPLAAEVKAAVHRAADAAARAWAHVEHAKPKIDGGALMGAYMTLLMFVLMAQDGDIDGAERQRSEMKQRLAEFFGQGWDAILMPVSMAPPFKHQQEPTFQERILDVDGVATPYPLMLNWISVATALHAPAIAVQAGQTASGLPVGVQFVGPWNGEDRLFDFAAAVEDGLGGFKPPKI